MAKYTYDDGHGRMFVVDTPEEAAAGSVKAKKEREMEHIEWCRHPQEGCICPDTEDVDDAIHQILVKKGQQACKIAQDASEEVLDILMHSYAYRRPLTDDELRDLSKCIVEAEKKLRFLYYKK